MSEFTGLEQNKKDMSESVEHLREKLFQTENAFSSFVIHLNGVLKDFTSSSSEEEDAFFFKKMVEMHKNFLNSREAQFANGF